MKQVRDGSRILQFDGEQLAASTSWRNGSQRWIEFKLFKTESGVYILSRIGVSMLYHAPECVVVRRNKLSERPYTELDRLSVPCTQCRPDRTNFPLICPEQPRYWAQRCDSAEAVRESLMKYDDAGNKYLTLVARDLLERASEVDAEINDAYRIETIS